MENAAQMMTVAALFIEEKSRKDFCAIVHVYE